jgi:PAS domain S-box-containing protein
VFAVAWIGLSDKVLELFLNDPEKLTDLQTAKGFLFVLTTATLLYVMVRNQMRRLNQYQGKLKHTITDYRELHDKFSKQNHALKEANNKVRDNELFLVGVLENIPHLVFVKDMQKGTYILVNKAVEHLIQKQRAEIVNRDDFSLFPYEKAQSIVAQDTEIAQKGQGAMFDEYIPTPQGERVLHTVKMPILDAEGKFRFLLGVSEDITPKKQAEIELIRAKEKAEENNLLKTAFLQNISHEIRTPMNAICGFSELLLEHHLTEKKIREYTDLIQHNAHQLLNIVNDVLTMSRLETNQLEAHYESVDLYVFLEKLFQAFNRTSHSRPVEWRHTSTVPKGTFIRTDPTKLMQILSNLLNNALKFTHSGYIELHCGLEENNVHFSVNDTGIGFNPEMKERIFERFVQANDDINKLYGGTGLGLSICKALVELMGGQITVDTEEGKGTAFHFNLPLQKTEEGIQKEPLRTSGAPAHEETSKEPITILIAEDEDMNYLLIETLLQSDRWQLTRAIDGEEAVRIALNDPTIQLILMDIRMPLKNGQEAALEIKQFRPKLPIIAQTAYVLDAEVEKYRGAFDDYLTKPLRSNILLQKVEFHLAQHL